MSTPTTGVSFTTAEIEFILASVTPPLKLQSYEVSTLGYNNRVYFLRTTCSKDLVLKAGGRYWKRQKTEAEVAGHLVARYLSHGRISVPQVIGFSSKRSSTGDVVDGLKEGGLPWEWVLLEKVDGMVLTSLWPTLSGEQQIHVARKIADTVVELKAIPAHSFTKSSLRTLIGNLSFTPVEKNACAGHDHTSIPLDESVLHPLSRIHISSILNGPPPSSSCVAYVHSLLEKEIESQSTLSTPSPFGVELHPARLPRLRNLLAKIHDHPTIAMITASPDWNPVFTHGDFAPRNILVSFPEEGGADTDPLVTILDWEWAGFFPPHIEWDAGLNELLDLFSGPTTLSTLDMQTPHDLFLSTLHSASVVTPFSGSRDQWECAMKMLRLIECLDPWWLPSDLSALNEEERKEVEEKRVTLLSELDDLLDFFDA